MRIVLVGEETTAGKLLQFVLTEADYTVVWARSTPAIAKEAVVNGADAALICSDLADFSNAELCRELRAQAYTGPVLVCGEGHKSLILQSYDYGADDYIVEPFDTGEVLARINAVMRRCQILDEEILGIVRAGDVELSIGQLTFKAPGSMPVRLTPIEMRLLECLMRNEGITVTSEKLLRWAWGYDATSDSNKVQVYMLRLRRKIEREGANCCHIDTVRGVGYVFVSAARQPTPDESLVISESTKVGPRYIAPSDELVAASFC